jgi:hypothetical protein
LCSARVDHAEVATIVVVDETRQLSIAPSEIVVALEEVVVVDVPTIFLFIKNKYLNKYFRSTNGTTWTEFTP